MRGILFSCAMAVVWAACGGGEGAREEVDLGADLSTGSAPDLAVAPDLTAPSASDLAAGPDLAPIVDLLPPADLTPLGLRAEVATLDFGSAVQNTTGELHEFWIANDGSVASGSITLTLSGPGAASFQKGY